MHQSLAAGWWPKRDAHFPSEGALLPPLPATLQEIIDHLGRRILGERPGRQVSRGIAQLLGIPLHRRVPHPALRGWTVRALAPALLDSPPPPPP